MSATDNHPSKTVKAEAENEATKFDIYVKLSHDHGWEVRSQIFDTYTTCIHTQYTYILTQAAHEVHAPSIVLQLIAILTGLPLPDKK